MGRLSHPRNPGSISVDVSSNAQDESPGDRVQTRGGIARAASAPLFLHGTSLECRFFFTLRRTFLSRDHTVLPRRTKSVRERAVVPIFFFANTLSRGYTVTRGAKAPTKVARPPFFASLRLVESVVRPLWRPGGTSSAVCFFGQWWHVATFFSGDLEFGRESGLLRRRSHWQAL